MSTWSYIVSDDEEPPKYKDDEVGSIEIRMDDHFVSIILWPYTNKDDDHPFFDLTVSLSKYRYILDVVSALGTGAMGDPTAGYVQGPMFTRTSYSTRLPAWTSLRNLVEYIAVGGQRESH